MSNPVLTALALAEALFPRQVIAFWESVAFEDRGEATLRGWTVSIARLEGLVFVALLRRERPLSRQLAPLFGLLGLPMVLWPRRVLAFSLGVAYDRAEEIELQPWVEPLTRLLGVTYLVVAIKGLVRARATRETATE